MSYNIPNIQLQRVRVIIFTAEGRSLYKRIYRLFGQSGCEKNVAILKWDFTQYKFFMEVLALLYRVCWKQRQGIYYKIGDEKQHKAPNMVIEW